MASIGKLLEVDVRELWKHEQYDFSNWLAKEAKLSRFINVVNNRKSELEEFHIDKALSWDNFRLNQLQN